MSESVGRIDLDLGINYREFNRETRNIAGTVTNTVTSAFRSLAGIIAGAFAVNEMIQFGKASLKLASDLQEVQNVVDVTFGEMSQEIDDFAKSALTGFGMSELSAKKFSSTMGAMLKSSGLAGDQMTTMAQELTALAGDMASFYNLDHESAFQKIRAGISGETEPLRQLGVNMSVANLEAYALSQGIRKSHQQMSQAEQVLLRYNYLLDVTKDAQGDFARTSTSWANQTRILSEQWKIFQGTMGQGFMNILTPVVKMINTLIQRLQLAASYFKAFTELVFGSQKAANQGSAAFTNATSALGDMSSDAIAAGKSVKQAGKDVKGSLSNFDQLNVIAQTASEGFGDVTGGVAGIGEVDLGTAAPVEDKKIDLGVKFDFAGLDNIKAAFAGLWSSLQPVINTLGEALKWFYDNCLKPIGAWVVNDAVPAFFNVLAGAFSILNPLLLAFKPIGLWLFENWLVPLAKWSGKLFINALNAIGTALGKIGDWMRSNQATVDKITVAVLAFMGAWKLTQLLAFIQMSGGIVGAIRGIVASIKAGTVAKIADKLATIALTALYAKDFVVALAASASALVANAKVWVANTLVRVANTAATWLAVAGQTALTIAMTAWNVICGIATAVTTAFGVAVAFLTSPIGLTVLAIAALVAGIVLLIKNWDWVKEKASEVWARIKEIWGSAAKWFEERVSVPIGRIFNKVLDDIKDVIASIWGSITSNFRSGINVIVDLVNFLIRQLNKISFSVPNWVPGIGGRRWGINIDPVPKLAEGGLITGPTLAMVGDNKRANVDPEVVTPLSKLQDMLGASNQVVVEVLSMILEAIEKQSNVIEIDGEVLTRVMSNKLNAENNRVGKKMIVVGGV